MRLIDFILNLAGLLLWFNWCATRCGTQRTPAVAIQAGTGGRNLSFPPLCWLSLAALFGLVCGRAFFYRLLGPAVDWTAGLDLGAITLYFRTDEFTLALLFSALSFARALVLAYVWMLAVYVLTRNSAAQDWISRFIRLRLSLLARWPFYVQVLLPMFFVVAAWPGLHALLTHVGITSRLPTFGRLILQGTLVGLGTYLSLKYLITAVLLADLLARYVYFGRGPIWDFVSTTAQRLLAPLRRLPLRAGKMDFAPVVGVALTLLLMHWLPRWVLFELNKRNLTVWPQ
jgi:uncharacterized protein YggT (Ycf19 family)